LAIEQWAGGNFLGSTDAKRASGNHPRGGGDGFVVSGKTVEERYWLPENLGGLKSIVLMVVQLLIPQAVEVPEWSLSVQEYKPLAIHSITHQS
jgi:hypothetical protein